MWGYATALLTVHHETREQADLLYDHANSQLCAPRRATH